MERRRERADVEEGERGAPGGPERFVCMVCGEEKPRSEALHGEFAAPGVQKLVQAHRAEWRPEDLICLACLHQFRTGFVEDVLETERGELSALEREVMKSLQEQETLARNINVQFDRQVTRAERAADAIARFGGSWRFIGAFGGVMAAWILINTAFAIGKPFDPYPFILLNLGLSCLAALQAPIIMMSQNRQEEKDRMRAEHDYKVNLKAELEIRHVNVKLDQLLTHQWRRLLEIQRIQLELMEEMMAKRKEEEKK